MAMEALGAWAMVMAVDVAVSTDWAVAVVWVAMETALALEAMGMATVVHFPMEDVGSPPSIERLAWETNT